MINKKRSITYEKIEATKSSDINLVFVHGTGCNRNFLRVLAEMFQEYNCYLIDLPGHGDSDNTGYTAENYVNAIKNFVSDMENVILIGHSLGGALVLGTGELNLSSVKGLVILNSAAKFYKVDSELKESILQDKISVDKFSAMLGNLDNPEVMEAVMKSENLDVFLQDSKISIVVDYEKNIRDIKVPVCIITGDKDMFAYPEFSEYLNNEIEKSELFIMQDTMHSLPIVKKKEVYEIIKQFFNKYKI